MEQGKAELGTLLISVGYLKQSSVVEVDVIQAKKLPGLEKTNVKYLCNSGEFIQACSNGFLKYEGIISLPFFRLTWSICSADFDANMGIYQWFKI